MPEPSGAPPKGRDPGATRQDPRPPEDASSDADVPAEDTAPGSPDGLAPPRVLDRLREQYESAGEDRQITIAIAPGRFNGNLVARYRTIPWTDTRKRARRAQKSGLSEESELNFAAGQLAKACETILIRLEDGGDFIPLNTVPGTDFGDMPVRYDERLCRTLGIDPAPGSPTGICRMVFRNPHALNDHYLEFEQFIKEASEGDEADEDDEPATLADRPT